MSYYRISGLLIAYATIVVWMCWLVTSCQTPQETVRYVRPIPVDPVERTKPGTQQPRTDCPHPRYQGDPPPLLEVAYFHKRCQAIYERPQYCNTFYRQRHNADGSRHIDILCGIPLEVIP